ncbi:general secretion pathway protein GspM [Glaciecola punicea]|uniref:type II secretion system protein M n=1 Tax=Glaciecola punicea TaxID=56804 RepID=UPI000872A0B0|nr:type II secretion system protein M [Glaciecola punicea]OFA31861.1 general secretion pathway protein GspM [Glaciecola punicea]
MDKLKAWFVSISAREQKLVIVAAAVAIIGIFYFAIWSPLTSALETQGLALNSEKQLLTWVNEQSGRAIVLRQSSNKTSFNGSLTQVVNQTTRSANIPVARMQPQGEELVVSLDQVVFNDFLRWLNVLEKRGVVILQSDVSEVDEQGFVQVRRLQLGKS